MITKIIKWLRTLPSTLLNDYIAKLTLNYTDKVHELKTMIKRTNKPKTFIAYKKFDDMIVDRMGPIGKILMSRWKK